jgi:cob(I)alamin adenosyltransferase
LGFSISFGNVVFYLNGFNSKITIFLLDGFLMFVLSSKDGLVIVYTGNGKGKTTAALGMALRAIGYDHKVCMLQFIKGSWHYGEMDSSKKLEPNFELIAIGKGFVGILDDNSPREEHEKYAAEALRICREKIFSEKYNVVILDEVNYAINLGLIDVQEIIKIIKEKPSSLDLVLTGRDAKEEIIELADLVTEMKEIKHPFKSGIKAKKGIDF